MADEKCPKCGAELVRDEYPGYKHYACDTYFDRRLYRSNECYEEQIKQQHKEIEVLIFALKLAADEYIDLEPTHKETQEELVVRWRKTARILREEGVTDLGEAG